MGFPHVFLGRRKVWHLWWSYGGDNSEWFVVSLLRNNPYGLSLGMQHCILSPCFPKSAACFPLLDITGRDDSRVFFSIGLFLYFCPSAILPRLTKIQKMKTTTNSNGILTEQDLVFSWASMLKATQATHVEVNPDQLLFGLIDVTRTHYTQMGISRPQMQTLEDFYRTRWQWKRLKEKLKTSRLG